MSVFDMKNGMRVYDKARNRYGTVQGTGETAPEAIEAFVIWDGNYKEEILAMEADQYLIVG